VAAAADLDLGNVCKTFESCRTFASLSEFGQECCFGLDIWLRGSKQQQGEFVLILTFDY
jgi:hypothetical protein